MRTAISERLGIEFPIFAFSHCRDVVAAVSKAGGFGVLGALAFTPEQLELELAWIDDNINGKPYGVDIVIPAAYEGSELGEADMLETLEKLIPAEHRKFIEETLEKYRVPRLSDSEPAMSGLLAWNHAGAGRQVDVALAHPVRLIANALGTPPADIIEKCHSQGVLTAALTGSVRHAEAHVGAGVDVVVASGYEAGGHTGEITSLVLVPEVVDAVAPAPVLAAGGIGSGRQMAAAMALGAAGVWTGSIWLTTAESDTDPVIKEKLIAADSRDTARSRSLSGKPARQLKTAWTEAWDGPESPGTLDLPLQFLATADAVRRIHKFAGDPSTRARELVGSPVGQIVGSMKGERRVRDIVREMVEEYVDTVARLNQDLQQEG